MLAICKHTHQSHGLHPCCVVLLCLLSPPDRQTLYPLVSAVPSHPVLSVDVPHRTCGPRNLAFPLGSMFSGPVRVVGVDISKQALSVLCHRVLQEGDKKVRSCHLYHKRWQKLTRPCLCSSARASRQEHLETDRLFHTPHPTACSTLHRVLGCALKSISSPPCFPSVR